MTSLITWTTHFTSVTKRDTCWIVPALVRAGVDGNVIPSVSSLVSPWIWPLRIVRKFQIRRAIWCDMIEVGPRLWSVTFKGLYKAFLSIVEQYIILILVVICFFAEFGDKCRFRLIKWNWFFGFWIIKILHVIRENFSFADCAITWANDAANKYLPPNTLFFLAVLCNRSKQTVKADP